MCVYRVLDKENKAHRHNGILLSHKKEQNCAVCRDMGGTRDSHIEGSKSEKDKYISLISEI